MRKRTGKLPFGFDYLNHEIVTTALSKQHRASGLSLREIVSALNQKFIATKQNGLWQANTVRGILART